MSRSSDCIILLQYLEASGQQSLRKMSKETGIPFATIRDYINPNVLTWRSWEDINKMRDNSQAYNFYLSTIERPSSSGCHINISKFSYLVHYGIHYGYHVYYSKEKRRVFVQRLKEDDQWHFV